MKLEQHDETLSHKGASSASTAAGAATTRAGGGSTFEPPGVKDTAFSARVVELLYRTFDVPAESVYTTS
jgi:hypothetical protein